MNLKRYQKDLKRLKDSIDDAFSIFKKSTQKGDNDYVISPKVNIIDKGDHIELTVDLPNIDKKSLKVKVDNRNLIIQASKNKVKEQKGRDYFVKEIVDYDYYRSFYLSEELALNQISAEYEKGVLKITVKKKESEIPKEIDIKVN